MTAMPISESLVARAVFSLALICVAGWTAYKGSEFVRFHYLHGEVVAALSAEPANTPSSEDVGALRERLADWHDTPGLGYLARIDYRDAGTIFIQPPTAAIRDAAEVLKADPVNGQAWMDLAQASRRDPNLQTLALAAWQMSAIAAPREYPIMLRRLAFLLGAWPMAGEEQKRQFFFETSFLFNIGARSFRADWRNLLSYLPEDRRQAIEAEIRAYYPSYRR